MKFAGYINTRRIKSRRLLAVLAGAICLYGTLTSIPGVLTLPILATIFYDRVLLGFVVGIAYGLKIHPLIQGSNHRSCGQPAHNHSFGHHRRGAPHGSGRGLRHGHRSCGDQIFPWSESNLRRLDHILLSLQIIWILLTGKLPGWVLLVCCLQRRQKSLFRRIRCHKRRWSTTRYIHFSKYTGKHEVHCVSYPVGRCYPCSFGHRDKSE
jgi:hypothetical protein